MNNKFLIALTCSTFVFFASCNSNAKKENETTNTPIDTTTENTVNNDTITTIPEKYSQEDFQNNLTQQQWNLDFVEVNDKALKDFGSNKPVLTFKTDGTFTGRICNSMSGKYKLDTKTGTITLSQIIRTMMACDGEIMIAEDNFSESTYQFDITKGYLNLRNGKTFFTFSRKTTPNENPMAN